MESQSLHALAGRLECAGHLVERSVALCGCLGADPDVAGALIQAAHLLRQASAGLGRQLEEDLVRGPYVSNR